mgnify:FL=1
MKVAYYIITFFLRIVNVYLVSISNLIVFFYIIRTICYNYNKKFKIGVKMKKTMFICIILILFSGCAASKLDCRGKDPRCTNETGFDLIDINFF